MALFPELDQQSHRKKDSLFPELDSVPDSDSANNGSLFPELAKSTAGQPIYPPVNTASEIIKGLPDVASETLKDVGRKVGGESLQSLAALTPYFEKGVGNSEVVAPALLNAAKNLNPAGGSTKEDIANLFGPHIDTVLKQAEKSGADPSLLNTAKTYGNILARTMSETFAASVPTNPVEGAEFYAGGKVIGESAKALQEAFPALGRSVVDLVFKKNVIVPQENLPGVMKNVYEKWMDTYSKGASKAEANKVALDSFEQDAATARTTAETAAKANQSPPAEGTLPSTNAPGGVPATELQIPGKLQRNVEVAIENLRKAIGVRGEQPIETPGSVLGSEPSAQTGLEPTAQVPPAPAGISPVGEVPADQIFPATPVSSNPSIAQHPDFVKVSNDAAAIVNRYAKERGIQATPDFARELHSELHDALGEILRAPDDQKIEVAKQLKARYPTIENDFATLKDKLWSDTNQSYFERYIATTPVPKAPGSDMVIPPSGAKYLSSQFPVLGKAVEAVTPHVHPEVMKEATLNATAKAIAAQIRGATPDEAQQVALETFADHFKTASPPQTPNVAPEQPVQQVPSEQPDEEFGGVSHQSEYSVSPVDIQQQIQERGKAAAEKVLKANRIDDRVMVNLVHSIENDNAAFQAGRGRQFNSANEQIVGRTITSRQGDRLQAVIDLAKNATPRTGRHEAFHAVTNLLLSDKDQKVLLAKYENMEEAADAFADYQGGKKTGDSLIDRIFAKIKQFLEKFVNVLRGRGFKSADDIFGAIDEGKFGPETKAKFATSPETAFSARQNTFFSQVEQTIDEKMPAKASPDQVMGLLKNTPGIKQEEIDWLGLPEFLKGKTNVTKEQLQNFVRENNIQIQEVTKGGVSAEDAKRVNQLSRLMSRHAITPDEEAELSRLLQGGRQASKFDKYVLPGGENYRELLLTLPEKELPGEVKWEPYANGELIAYHKGKTFGIRPEDGEYYVFQASGILGHKEPTLAAAKNAVELVANEKALKGGFTSPHFNEPNILAHVRFNDRTDAEGKKVLFLEEVQSDWHQKGREQGYKHPIEIYQFDEPKIQEDEHQYFINTAGRKFSVGKGVVAGKVEAADYLHRLIDTANAEVQSDFKDLVPNAPFKKTWHELALKRMLRYAAENGYDKIAWTTGEQQAERYDLSKQISRIDYIKEGSGNKINIFNKEGKHIDGNFLTDARLPDYIGKEAAEKIINSTETKGSLSGLDLKVGGEGMKGFYDQMIPSFLNKYTKKWGGRVAETSLPGTELSVGSSERGLGKKITGGRQEIKVHSLDITPDMKESVLQGQPQFSVENKPEEPVKNRPFEITTKANDKTTSRGIREQFAGIKNEQIVRGNQLADEIRRSVPSKTEREGMFWFKAANGDLNTLANALDNPKFEPYRDQIQAALNLSPNAVRMLGKVDQYYTQTGAVSKEIGTVGNILDNYQNRLYLPEKAQDYVKTEMKSGIKQNTRHGMKRVYNTEFEAVVNGKRFATTDIADALSIHNEEMARVNTSRKMAEALVDKKLAAWKRDVPDGWAKIGNLEKRIRIKDKDGNAVIGEDGNQLVSTSYLVAPKGIAKGLSAIADPNFVKKIDSLRNLQQYQGLVKTVDLSFSFFHHFSMLMQTLYQGDLWTLLKLPAMGKILASPDFKALERDFVLHTGMTSKVESNQDILRDLLKNNDDTFSKIVNLPGIRNVLARANTSSEFLFGKLQRLMKVSDYGGKISNWVASHPDATNDEVTEAKKGFAKSVNSVYGGLNWEAMGMSKANLSLLRLVLLAPDWTISNLQLLGGVFKGGTYGSSSRSHVAMALLIGTVLTEGLNQLLTGHFTNKNKPGHKLEVEIAPNVYVSFFRGGIGDIVKFGSMVSESGLAGVSRFAQGKMAPLPRTAVGLLTNTQYTGRPVTRKTAGPVKGTFDTLEYLLSSAFPLPLGASNFLQYAKTGGVTPAGAAAVLTGIGRFSKGKVKAYK